MKAAKFILLILFLLLVSCKLFNPFQEDKPKDSLNIGSLAVGPEGGEFSATDKDGNILLTLTIPQGAVQEETTLSISSEESKTDSIYNSFKLNPAGIKFSKPIEISFFYNSIIESLGIPADSLMPYMVSDDNTINPIYDYNNDTTESSITFSVSHFSSIQISKPPIKLSPDEIALIAEVYGFKLSPELLERLKTVFDIYTQAVDNISDPESLIKGADAVKSWCNANPDLKPGGGWKNDNYIVGYRLTVVAHYLTLDDEIKTFEYIYYSNLGDIEPTSGDYYVLMVNQNHSKDVITSNISALQVFDISVQQLVSIPRLNITSSKTISMQDGETYNLEGNLYCNIKPYGKPETQTLGIPNETVRFSLNNTPGTLSETSAITGVNGLFSTTFTSGWETITIEPEISDIDIGFTHGKTSISDSVSIIEYNEPEDTFLVTSSYPENEATDIPVDTQITISFNNQADTDSVEENLIILPGFDYTLSWTGNRILAIQPNTELNYLSNYYIGVNAGAEDIYGHTLQSGAVFSFKTQSEPPKILSTQPEESTENVTVSSFIRLVFSKEMDTSSVENALSVMPLINFSTSWDESNSCLILFPDENLAYNTQFTVSIDSTAAASNGQELSSAFSLSFTTETEGENSPPVVTDCLYTQYLDESNEFFVSEGGYLFAVPATDDSTDQGDLRYILVRSAYTIPDIQTALLMNELVPNWQPLGDSPNAFRLPPYAIAGNTYWFTLLVKDEDNSISMYPPVAYTYPGSIDIRVLQGKSSFTISTEENNVSQNEVAVFLPYNADGDCTAVPLGMYPLGGMPEEFDYEAGSPAEYQGFKGTCSLSGTTLQLNCDTPYSTNTTGNTAHFYYSIPNVVCTESSDALLGPTAAFSGNPGEYVGTYSIEGFDFDYKFGTIYVRSGTINQTLTLNGDGSFEFHRTVTGTYASLSGSWYGYYSIYMNENDANLGLMARTYINETTGETNTDCTDTVGMEFFQVSSTDGCFVRAKNTGFLNLFAIGRLGNPAYFFY